MEIFSTRTLFPSHIEPNSSQPTDNQSRREGVASQQKSNLTDTPDVFQTPPAFQVSIIQALRSSNKRARYSSYFLCRLLQFMMHHELSNCSFFL